MLSMYLTCSGYTQDDNLCIDRVVCEYANEESNLKKNEREVIAM